MNQIGIYHKAFRITLKYKRDYEYLQKIYTSLMRIEKMKQISETNSTTTIN